MADDVECSSDLRDRRAPTILIVEDHEDCREMLRKAIENDGFGVIEAANGRQALDILFSAEAPEPGLILLDLNMPVMSGLEMLTVIQRYHRLARIPVVVASASKLHADPRLPAIAAQLVKPIDAQRLLDAVRQHTQTPALSH